MDIEPKSDTEQKEMQLESGNNDPSVLDLNKYSMLYPENAETTRTAGIC